MLMPFVSFLMFVIQRDGDHIPSYLFLSYSQDPKPINPVAEFKGLRVISRRLNW